MFLFKRNINFIYFLITFFIFIMLAFKNFDLNNIFFNTTFCEKVPLLPFDNINNDIILNLNIEDNTNKYQKLPMYIGGFFVIICLGSFFLSLYPIYISNIYYIYINYILTNLELIMKGTNCSYINGFSLSDYIFKLIEIANINRNIPLNEYDIYLIFLEIQKFIINSNFQSSDVETFKLFLQTLIFTWK